MAKVFLRYLFGLFLPGMLSLLPPVAAESQVLPIRNYGIREGLNAGSVSAVLRDSRGMLWVGTYNGVNLYDGSRFQQPKMSTRSGQIYVTQFCEDQAHQIWVSSWYSGLYKYANGVFANYLPDTANIGAQANSILHLTSLPDGRMLCGTDHNAYIFDGTRFSLLDAGNSKLNRQITATACTPRGDLFIGLSDGLAQYVRTGTGWEYARTLLEGSDINKLVVAGDTLWIATNRGLYCQPVNGVRVQLSQMVESPVINVFPDANHTLWYTTTGNGIWRQQPGKAAGHITLDNGLPSSQVVCGCGDVEGIVWLGTTNGLAKLTPAGYRLFPVQEGAEGANITALAKDRQQRLWVGSYTNIYRFDGADAHEQERPDGRNYAFVNAILKDRRQRLWVCAASGVYLIDNGVSQSIYPGEYTSISEDAAGVIWLGGQEGQVLCYENDKIRVMDQERLDERITGIAHDGDGNLWIGYALSGLRKMQCVHDSIRPVRSWSEKNGYRGLHVRSLRDDKRGHLLVGTRTGGLFIVAREDGSVQNITRDRGLSGNWVKDIVVGDKEIYLATNNGLDVLEAGVYRAPVRHITFNDDRVPVEFNTALLQSDTLWLGTSRGVLEYSLHGQLPDSLAPPVRLLKLAVNGEADSGFRPFTEDERLRRLGHSENNISVDFTALSFRDEDRVRYRYRLEGLDTGWNVFTDRRYVNYMNLAPGDYRFLVEARNGDGLLSREPAAVSFSIAAPFWATSWFITGAILLLLGLAYGFYRYRLHQALAIERLRARISTDLHDDTGSTLSSISILSDMAMQEEAARGGGDGATLTPMLKEIRDSSLSLLEKMDDIVWSINPRNDTLESLMLRVKRFAAQLFEARGIEYEIDIEPDIRRLRLLMDHRQNLYLIMKEAINNLVKYSGAARAHIRASYLRHHLLVEISDDGSGFSPETIASGNGIINMKNRAACMDADLGIRTSPGEGTTVSLSLKINRS